MHKHSLSSIITLLKLPIIMLMVLLGSPAIAISADKHQQLIDAIFQLSGVDTLFVQLPVLIESTFEQMEAQKVDARIGEVKQAMNKAFSPRKLRNNAIEYINKKLSIKQLKKIHTYLSSPLAMKVTALENAANKADSVAKMIAYARQLQKTPPTDVRIELIAELINASNAVESSLAVRTEFFRGFMEAASQLDPIEDRMSSEQIDLQIAMLHTQMEESTAQEVILAFLYTYQSLQNKELEQYIKMYQQKPMVAFTANINKAIAHSFRAAGKQMKKDMQVKLRTS